MVGLYSGGEAIVGGLRYNNVFFMLFVVYYKISIIHLELLSLIQLPDYRVKIDQFLLFLEKLAWSPIIIICTTEIALITTEL